MWKTCEIVRENYTRHVDKPKCKQTKTQHIVAAKSVHRTNINNTYSNS